MTASQREPDAPKPAPFQTVIQARIAGDPLGFPPSRLVDDNGLYGNGIKFGFWACQRPLTKTWGSGQVYRRLSLSFGPPDAAFGVQDNIPEGPAWIDRNTGYEWAKLPFPDNHFAFGYWDPPYYKLDKWGKATRKPSLFKKEGQEIWRVCRRLAILHTHVWPRAWLRGAEREGMVAVTMGPMKVVRLLQVHRKAVLP